MLEQLKQMNQELAELKQKHLEMSKTMFKDVAAKLFEKHSSLESFGWTQYTPYFNDGEECTFSVNKDYPYINGVNIDDLDGLEKVTIKVYGTWDRDTGKYVGRVEEPNESYNPELSLAVTDVGLFLDEIDDSVFRNMFGDHVKVTVDREGVNVASYRHD